MSRSQAGASLLWVFELRQKLLIRSFWARPDLWELRGVGNAVESWCFAERDSPCQPFCSEGDVGREVTVSEARWCAWRRAAARVWAPWMER